MAYPFVFKGYYALDCYQYVSKNKVGYPVAFFHEIFSYFYSQRSKFNGKAGIYFSRNGKLEIEKRISK